MVESAVSTNENAMLLALQSAECSNLSLSLSEKKACASRPQSPEQAQRHELRS